MSALEDDTNDFENILNFRDVAIAVNRHEKNNNLRPGKLYRSARPDTASATDKRRLVQQYGIKTIIDLRSKTEHIEAAKKASESRHLASKTSTSPSDRDRCGSIKIPEIQYAEINLNGKGFERHLVWQLSYVNLAWLITYMVLGYRIEGINIIGKNVLLPRGLIGLGHDTLQHSGPEIRAVFDVLANAESYPVLVHCTQGKDRTGLIVILVLLLCGTETTAISEDYTMSERELVDEYEERMKEIRSIGLDESFAGCPTTFVQETVSFIDSRYGSIERYLNRVGVSDKQMHQVRTLLQR